MNKKDFDKKVKEITVLRELKKEHLAILAMQLREEVERLIRMYSYGY